MSDELSPNDIALINRTPKAKAHFEEWGDGFWALRCAKLLRDAGDIPITARLFNCLSCLEIMRDAKEIGEGAPLIRSDQPVQSTPRRRR